MKPFLHPTVIVSPLYILWTKHFATRYYIVHISCSYKRKDWFLALHSQGFIHYADIDVIYVVMQTMHIIFYYRKDSWTIVFPSKVHRFSKILNWFLTDPPIPCVDTKTCIEVLNISRGLSCQNGYCLCENDGQTKNCSSNNITHISRSTGKKSLLSFFLQMKNPV